MQGIFYIVVLIMSVVIHEVSHGFMAEYFGDKTARYAGRLTINPIKHLDLFGSIILPGLLILSGTHFLFGWAKPVPYNPNNLRNKKWGTIAVASAGVIANFSIAIIFSIIIRVAMHYTVPAGFFEITSLIVIVNLGLGLFNLIPIAPLDGSKILFSFLPASAQPLIDWIEKYSIFLLIIFIVFFSGVLLPVLVYLYHLLTGLAF